LNEEALRTLVARGHEGFLVASDSKFFRDLNAKLLKRCEEVKGVRVVPPNYSNSMSSLRAKW